MEKRFWIYIITDKPYGTLYTGVTNDLARRVWEHKEGYYKGVSSRYRLRLLVYYEEYPTVMEAIDREKKIKKWKRDWKKQLIEKLNPTWRDLHELF